MLREVVFGRYQMQKIHALTGDTVYAGHFVVEAEGWTLSLYNDCDALGYCEACKAPDGRQWSFDSGDRFGTDPVAMLSTWEHQTLKRLFNAFKRIAQQASKSEKEHSFAGTAAEAYRILPKA